MHEGQALLLQLVSLEETSGRAKQPMPDLGLDLGNLPPIPEMDTRTTRRRRREPAPAPGEAQPKRTRGATHTAAPSRL